MSTGEDMQLAVVGAGYVGLVTAACLAQAGHNVLCIDRDRARIAALSQGVVPFREPGLDQAMTTGLASGRLSFSDDLAATHAAEAVSIAVGTLGSDGEWSSGQLEAAVQSVAADWPLYASIDWHAARALMTGDVVIDARGVIDRAAAADAGLRLVVHGRAVATAQPQTQIE